MAGGSLFASLGEIHAESRFTYKQNRCDANGPAFCLHDLGYSSDLPKKKRWRIRRMHPNHPSTSQISVFLGPYSPFAPGTTLLCKTFGCARTLHSTQHPWYSKAEDGIARRGLVLSKGNYFGGCEQGKTICRGQYIPSD